MGWNWYVSKSALAPSKDATEPELAGTRHNPSRLNVKMYWRSMYEVIEAYAERSESTLDFSATAVVS